MELQHFWFDASDENTVIKDANGKVSFWNDKISNKHLAQATTANQPTYGTRTYNGLPVMDFDGGDMMETINNVDMATDHRNPKRVGRNFQLWVVAYVDSVDHETIPFLPTVRMIEIINLMPGMPQIFTPE